MILNFKNWMITVVIVASFTSVTTAQNIDFDKDSSLGNLFIRMYGELHYYQPVNSTTYQQGKFDAKRMVALFGYQFNRNTQFVTEWELEHGNEIFLEQGFIKHKISGNTTIKAGMILIYLRWGGTTLVFGQNVNYYLNGIYFVTYRIE